jgi:hypothetical protein
MMEKTTMEKTTTILSKKKTMHRITITKTTTEKNIKTNKNNTQIILHTTNPHQSLPHTTPQYPSV